MNDLGKPKQETTMKRMKLGLTAVLVGVVAALSAVAQSDLNTADYSTVPYHAAKQDRSINNGSWGKVIADYSFKFDGGAVGNIDLDVQIPTNALITHCVVYVTSGLLPADYGNTNALTLNSYGDILAGGTNVLITAGAVAGIPISAATAVRCQGNLPLYLTRTGSAITSGVFTVEMDWVRILHD